MTSLPSSAVSWAVPAREAAFHDWLTATAAAHGLLPATLRTASADASFRRYLRVDSAAGPSRIVMDAPPAHEDCRPFVQIAAMLRGGGLQAPEVLAWDEAQGFMLLSDLGDTTYLAALRDLDLAQPAGQRTADAMYRAALGTLVRLQGIAGDTLPAYDEALMRRELDLFPTWYIGRHRGVTLSDAQQADLSRTFDTILQACLAQPRVLVHRDFHSRNLMVDPSGSNQPGVLDFQDAVHGPITYDLVSLLRDAYIEWDEEVQIDWAVRWWEAARKAGLPVDADFGTFWRDYEWMGLQRHLKVLGIFARLAHRDGKQGYLDDIPLVWRHAHHVAMRYSALKPLARLLEQVAGVEAASGYTF